MQKIIFKIEQENFEFLEDERLECFLLADGLSESFVKAFKEKAEAKEKIVLAEGKDNFLKYKEVGLDGLLVDFSKSENIDVDIKKIRQEVGSRTFLGVVSRNRRHEAMIASENEPDFVVFKVWKDGFEQTKEIIDWYAEFFLIQQAAYVQDEEVPFEQISSDILILNEKNYKIFVDKK